MRRAIEQLKLTDRKSRQIRHHGLYLNYICEQNLSRQLNALTDEYAQKLKYFKKQQKVEQRRKEVLDITIEQIAYGRKRHSLSDDAAQKTDPVLPKIDNRRHGNGGLSPDLFLERPSIPGSFKLPSIPSDCHLSPHACPLYPCQPIYHYRSFMTEDHDQTLRSRHPAVDDVDRHSPPTQLQTLLSEIEAEGHQFHRRQQVAAIKNQYRIANRHAYMIDAKARLDEQSRLLHERLTDKRTFGYAKERQKDLRQSIQRHLEISAKFCA